LGRNEVEDVEEVREAIGVFVKKAESELQRLKAGLNLQRLMSWLQATTYKDSLVLTTANILEF
jgi:hypothetical protein